MYGPLQPSPWSSYGNFPSWWEERSCPRWVTFTTGAPSNYKFAFCGCSFLDSERFIQMGLYLRGLLCLASLTLLHAFKVQPHCSMCQCSIPLHGWIILVSGYTVSCSSIQVGWHLGCFHLLAVIKHASLVVCIPVSGSMYALISLG